MLLLAWARISKKRAVIWQTWLLYLLAPFKKKNLSPEARRGDRPVHPVPYLRVSTVKNSEYKQVKSQSKFYFNSYS